MPRSWGSRNLRTAGAPGQRRPGRGHPGTQAGTGSADRLCAILCQRHPGDVPGTTRPGHAGCVLTPGRLPCPQPSCVHGLPSSKGCCSTGCCSTRTAAATGMLLQRLLPPRGSVQAPGSACARGRSPACASGHRTALFPRSAPAAWLNRGDKQDNGEWASVDSGAPVRPSGANDRKEAGTEQGRRCWLHPRPSYEVVQEERRVRGTGTGRTSLAPVQGQETRRQRARVPLGSGSVQKDGRSRGRWGASPAWLVPLERVTRGTALRTRSRHAAPHYRQWADRLSRCSFLSAVKGKSCSSRLGRKGPAGATAARATAAGRHRRAGAGPVSWTCSFEWLFQPPQAARNPLQEGETGSRDGRRPGPAAAAP